MGICARACISEMLQMIDYISHRTGFMKNDSNLY